MRCQDDVSPRAGSDVIVGISGPRLRNGTAPARANNRPIYGRLRRHRSALGRSRSPPDRDFSQCSVPFPDRDHRSAAARMTQSQRNTRFQLRCDASCRSYGPARRRPCGRSAEMARPSAGAVTRRRSAELRTGTRPVRVLHNRRAVVAARHRRLEIDDVRRAPRDREHTMRRYYSGSRHSASSCARSRRKRRRYHRHQPVSTSAVAP